jgi:membrane protease YdiL (CAAX protease family)
LDSFRVAAFQLPLKRIGSSILFGVAAGIPFAIINNLYFYINSHSVQFQRVFSSAFKALNAGIGEEIVFRFFILALCFTLLKSSETPRLVIIASVTMAVVPHSLNHFPDLFLDNALMGFAVFLANVLLFGLPMAWLQIRKNLETAMAFHWFIDFARFLFGF